MNPQNRAALDRAERAGYLPGLRRIANQACVPFWWHSGGISNDYRILNNGTLCLVDTGRRKIGVTADHVYSEYLCNKQLIPEVVCQIGGTTFTPEERLIDRSATLDLASFELTDVVVAASGGYFHAPPTWPTSVVHEGDAILLGGYPGRLRDKGEATAEMPFQWFVGAAASVSPFNVSLNLDLNNMHQPLRPRAQLNSDLGGMSGGPVFRFVPTPIERLELVGFIYEYQESYELILARPAVCVQDIGMLAPN